MQQYYCNYYFAPSLPFDEAVDVLLDQLPKEDCLVRLVFFGSTESNTVYLRELDSLRRKIEAKESMKSVVFSYVVQPLLGQNRWAVEAHYLAKSRVEAIECKQMDSTSYSIIDTPDARLLMVGGVMGSALTDSIGKQADEAFDVIERILKHEGIPICHIVRQWNYIEQITQMEGSVQHYQAFNDSRSLFYAKTSWEQTGYPAATGIGTDLGGVMIDLIAATPRCEAQTVIVPVDNPLQVAAHVYSQSVLLGEQSRKLKERSTPKFERAKVVGNARGESICFVSGTAAIRGELSIADMSIEQQTVVTLENIDHLVSSSNLRRSGFEPNEEHRLGNLRVYLKTASDYAEAKQVIERQTPCAEQIYLVADVCREELLIEIEGIASNVN